MAERDRETILQEIAAQTERMEQDLSAIRRTLRRPLEAEIARGNLTAPQKAAMRVIVRTPGIALKDLSKELNLAHSTVSGIADRLAKNGLVERRPDPQDRRSCCIYPTDVVNDFVREQIPALTRGPLQAALEQATPEERASIEHGLRRLRELLDTNPSSL